MTTPSCIWCQKQATEVGTPLLSCPGCNIVRYCSMGCQESDRRRHHNAECSFLSRDITRQPSTRAYVGKNCNHFEPDPDIINYVKTSIARRPMVYPSGPYYPADAMTADIHAILQAEGAVPGYTQFVAEVKKVGMGFINLLQSALPGGDTEQSRQVSSASLTSHTTKSD